MRHRLFPYAIAPGWRGPRTRSIVEFNVLVEDDVALVVLHDVVAVQTVALVVEIIFAFGAREFLGGDDRLADFLRVGRASLVDRRGEHRDGVVGPRALVVRRDLVGVAIGFAELLGAFAGILGVIGDTVSAVQRRTGQLQGRHVD